MCYFAFKIMIFPIQNCQTALHIAVTNGRAKVVELLLAAGIDINVDRVNGS